MRNFSTMRPLWYLAGLAGLVALIAGMHPMISFFKSSGAFRDQPGQSVVRRVEYSFTVQNTMGAVVKGVELWTYAPARETAHQKCLSISTSHPYSQEDDAHGNQVLHFSFDVLPPYGTKIVTIRADIELTEHPGRQPLKPLPAYQAPAPFIESDHPAIVEPAGKLSGATVFTTAQSAFDWVSRNIQYSGYQSSERGALYALQKRKGDCTELMDLFIALCRARKIPARAVGGYICPTDCVLEASAYHNWAEFYADGQWHLADPQQKVFRDKGLQYIGMRLSGTALQNSMGEAHRFKYSGSGIKVKMSQ